MEQFLLAVHLIRVFFLTNGHSDNGLLAHPHQFLDQTVLYRGKSRKPVEYHHTVRKDLRLYQGSAQHIQRLLCSDKMVSDIILKSPVQSL